MSKKKVTANNFNDVLLNISNLYETESKEGKKCWHEAFNEMLDNLRDEDFFGTEGQCDPRGDNRD